MIILNKIDIKNEHTIYMIIFSILVVLIIHIPEIYNPIQFYDDKHTIQPFIQDCSVKQIPTIRDPLRYYELCVSRYELGNIEILPVVSIFSLSVFVFILTKQFVNSNLLGLLGMILLLLTNSFSFYGFSATYAQTWVALMFCSLILIRTRFYYLSVIPFLISLFFRGLPLLDIPIFFGMIYISNIKRKRMIYTLFLIVGLLSSLYAILGNEYIEQNGVITNNIKFDTVSYFFSTFRYEIILSFCIPFIGLFLYKLKNKNSQFIFFSMTYLITQIWFLGAFTNLSQEPYRMFPLYIFAIIGITLIIKNYIIEKKALYF